MSLSYPIKCLNDSWNLKMITTFKFILDPRGLTQQFITGEPRKNQFSSPGPHHFVQRKTKMQQVLGTRERGDYYLSTWLQGQHTLTGVITRKDARCMTMGSQPLCPHHIPPNWYLVSSMILAMTTVCFGGRRMALVDLAG